MKDVVGYRILSRADVMVIIPDVNGWQRIPKRLTRDVELPDWTYMGKSADRYHFSVKNLWNAGPYNRDVHYLEVWLSDVEVVRSTT